MRQCGGGLVAPEILSQRINDETRRLTDKGETISK
jgi:hypothetical protein